MGQAPISLLILAESLLCSQDSHTLGTQEVDRRNINVVLLGAYHSLKMVAGPWRGSECLQSQPALVWLRCGNVITICI